MSRLDRDTIPQTTIRVSVETRDRLKALLADRTRELTRGRLWGRRYGDTAPVTMDDVIRELLNAADVKRAAS